MNSEIELRVYDIDKDKFIEKLNEAGAIFIDKYDQKRYIYDFDPVDEHKFIRLRTNGKKTTLTIKEHLSSSIDGMKELEVEVSDMEKTNLILERLGYKRRSIQQNKRIRYILDDVEIDIDRWPYLKDYVEFESFNEENIYNVLKKLDIDIKDTTTKIAQDFYYDEGYKKEDLNNLCFEEE